VAQGPAQLVEGTAQLGLCLLLLLLRLLLLLPLVLRQPTRELPPPRHEL
jgi:hypothetical protein